MLCVALKWRYLKWVVNEIGPKNAMPNADGRLSLTLLLMSMLFVAVDRDMGGLMCDGYETWTEAS